MTDALALLKQEARIKAVEFVPSGMKVGLGTGSTTIFATRRIAELIHAGTLRDIVGFATSKATWAGAVHLDIPTMRDDAAPFATAPAGSRALKPTLSMVPGT